jgi:hypothetical protein
MAFESFRDFVVDREINSWNQLQPCSLAQIAEAR